MSKQIIVVKPKSLSPKDKEKLTKAGNIVIEQAELSGMIRFYPTQGEEIVKYLYTNCCVCGDRIYVTEERLCALKEKKETFSCPQGHKQNFK